MMMTTANHHATSVAAESVGMVAAAAAAAEKAAEAEAEERVSAEGLLELRRNLTFELHAAESHTALSNIISLAPDERLRVRVTVHPSASANLLGLLPLDTPLLCGVLHIQSASSSGEGSLADEAEREREHADARKRREQREQRDSRESDGGGSVGPLGVGGKGGGGGGMGGGKGGGMGGGKGVGGDGDESMARELGIHDTICLVSSLRRGASFSLNVSHLNFHGVAAPYPSADQLFKKGGGADGGAGAGGSPGAGSLLGGGATKMLSSPPLSPAFPPKAPEQIESFWVRNPSLERPLSVRIQSEVPPEIGLMRVSPERARLLPGEEVQVFVTLLPRANVTEPGSGACLRVVDEHVAECSQAVRIVLIERQQLPRHSARGPPRRPPGRARCRRRFALGAWRLAARRATRRDAGAARHGHHAWRACCDGAPDDRRRGARVGARAAWRDPRRPIVAPVRGAPRPAELRQRARAVGAVGGEPRRRAPALSALPTDDGGG